MLPFFFGVPELLLHLLFPLLLLLALATLPLHLFHVSEIVHAGLVQMPDSVVRQADDGEVHALGHLRKVCQQRSKEEERRNSYLAKCLRFRVLLKAKGGKMHTGTEYLGFGQNADTADAVDFHLHIWVSVRIPEIGQMWPPCSILGVALYDDCILIQCLGQCQGRLRLLPRVQVVGLLSTEPIRQRSPDI